MKNIYDHIETVPGGREELMQEMASDFAYNPVRSEHAQDRLKDGPQHMPSPSEERIKAMLDFIGLNYYEDITVADIARAGNASEREVYRTFKSELGSTPQHYLRDYRVEQACRMLAHTTRPLAAVAHMSGLGSPSYFCKVFKDCTGKTPREYRRIWQ